ncbi:MAG TPA: hypothetical protein VM243_13195 [Phycisphaerae bacterium]|nr:hypothetical protein [Phycisphaerae bacterium]
MTTHQGSRFRLVIAAAGAAVVASVAVAQAGTVVPMNVETLANHAGQVLLGTVTDVRCYWADDPRRIESEITLEAVQYLKGALATSTTEFRLVVPGGTMGDMQMRVCCAPTFAVGDRWLLFLLPTYKTFPVVGITQGAFRIAADDQGIQRVYSERLSPVTGIDTEGFVKVGGTRRRSGHHHPVGQVNVRVKAEPAPVDVERAMTLGDFVDRVQPVIDASTDHHLTEPAGRPAPVSLKAVPLIRSTGTPVGAWDDAGRIAPVREAAQPGETQARPRGSEHDRRGATP